MKRPITIVSSISSLLFLIALIWFGAGIYIDRKNGTEKADQRYESLLTATKENFSHNAYGTSEFSNNFIRAIGNIDEFSSLKLEVNGELVYSYPPGLFSIPSPKVVKSYKETIFTDGGKSYTLSASIYLMSPNSIYKYSRFAFLLILIGTIIVIICIIIFNTFDYNPEYPSPYGIRSRKTKKSNIVYHPFAESKKTETIQTEEKPKAVESSRPEEPSQHEEPKAEQIQESPHSERTEEISETQEIIWNDDELFDEGEDDSGLDIIDQFEQQNAENASLNAEEFFSDEEYSEEEAKESSEENTEAPAIEQAPSSSEPLEAENDENLSPITNLLVQSSLEEKLDESIAAGNKNTTLILLKINGLDRGNSLSERVIEILKNSIADTQLFEYKSDAYAILAKDKDLQSAVDIFEEVYNTISDFLKNNNTTNEVSIGISSVNERNIKAERIILEANQALDYASQDPDSPIVAFRANPQKYQDFIENQ